MKYTQDQMLFTQSENGETYHHFDEWITPEGIMVFSVNNTSVSEELEFADKQCSCNNQFCKKES